jgi:AAA15 family ATPase/GTPase
MLIEFSLGNFWSFNDIQTLHMQSAAIRSKFPKVDQENLFQVAEDFSLLKSKAIFGANGSGKSNLVRGFSSMIRVIRDCIKDDQILSKEIIPFLLQRENHNQPSFFQIAFIANGVQYRYGFEADRKRITSEWLFGKPLKKDKKGTAVRERYYFTREGDDIKVNEKEFKEAVKFVPKKDESVPLYRENVLFLTLVSAFNGPLAKGIRDHLLNRINVSSGLDDPLNWILLINQLDNNQEFAERITRLLQSIDPHISKLEIIETPHEEVASSISMVEEPSNRQKAGYVVVHRILKDSAGQKLDISLTLHSQEAEGTKKLATLSPVLFHTLDKGGLLVIDEFDARLHPNLSRKIIELFHSLDTNPRNAQMVFVSHDSNLLDARLLRRDQIAFTKKDKTGATELYSLAEFKGVRNDSSFEKDYLMGKYNAVPTRLNVLEEAIQKYIVYGEK